VHIGLLALMLLPFLGILIFLVVLGVVFWQNLKERARRAGFASTVEYLRAAPRTDDEKRDAVDLALKGLVVCALGLLFPPFLLVGLFPLFYGARKLAFASMGLGLVDDAERSDA